MKIRLRQRRPSLTGIKLVGITWSLALIYLCFRGTVYLANKYPTIPPWWAILIVMAFGLMGYISIIAAIIIGTMDKE